MFSSNGTSINVLNSISTSLRGDNNCSAESVQGQEQCNESDVIQLTSVISTEPGPGEKVRTHIQVSGRERSPHIYIYKPSV